jgi:peptide/nickel transport system permease protein
VVGAFKGGLLLAVFVLAVLTAPPDVRVIRSVTLEERPRAYVEAARVMGLPSRRIIFSHVFPNILPIVVVNVCLNFTVALVALAALSFLGLGVGPGAADWGRMLFENRELMLANAWAALAPALMIMLTSTAANLAGDWAYERFEAKGTAR